MHEWVQTTKALFGSHVQTNATLTNRENERNLLGENTIIVLEKEEKDVGDC